jgi:hypothetical protein
MHHNDMSGDISSSSAPGNGLNQAENSALQVKNLQMGYLKRKEIVRSQQQERRGVSSATDIGLTAMSKITRISCIQPYLGRIVKQTTVLTGRNICAERDSR